MKKSYLLFLLVTACSTAFAQRQYAYTKHTPNQLAPRNRLSESSKVMVE